MTIRSKSQSKYRIFRLWRLTIYDWRNWSVITPLFYFGLTGYDAIRDLERTYVFGGCIPIPKPPNCVDPWLFRFEFPQFRYQHDEALSK